MTDNIDKPKLHKLEVPKMRKRVVGDRLILPSIDIDIMFKRHLNDDGTLNEDWIKENLDADELSQNEKEKM